MLKALRSPVIDLAVPECVDSEDADPKLVIVGDTHGQLADVLHIFQEHGTPSPTRLYLFNGDITDRGPESVEIWMLVLAFKIRYPQHVHVLRGNHENEKLNTRPVKWGGGFSDECNKKYPPHIFGIFNRLFTLLPVFAVVQGDIFVVHAGLFRSPGVTLEQLRSLPYREHYPDPPQANKSGKMTRGPWSDDESVLFDAQWADPQAKPGIGTSKRGKCVIAFGPDVTHQFLEANGLSLVIRSHEVPRSRRGFELTHNDKLMTVFSASNYGGLMGNHGAVAVIRSGPPPPHAPRGPVAVELPRGLSVQCVEHSPDQLKDEAGAGVRQARSAKKVLREFQGAPLGSRGCASEAANEVVRHALGLVNLERDELELRCNALDVHNQGHLGFNAIVEELEQAVCAEFDWGALLRSAGKFGERVQYRNLLAAIKVQWCALGQGQTAALAEAMLRAELDLDSLRDLFDYSRDGQVSPAELRRSLGLLLPNLSSEQVRHVQRLIGHSAFSLSQLMERLLQFLPPLALEEEWMGSALAHLGQVIQRWAGDGVALHAALLQFYTVFDEDLPPPRAPPAPGVAALLELLLLDLLPLDLAAASCN
ncbi:unnamed protein product [Prorocentrum cordatum]|uniref:Serine/threonine-protein phosphatase n=1 Tax=Prorocentrum cordatum TaxID=2364126 RepID=A0ABN9VD49_9DINO|nr:unnamed protein product [Polarella glacialis]